jgi:hypothetical protein
MGKFALHGVDPPIRSIPPGLDHADNRLPPGMHVHVLDRHHQRDSFFRGALDRFPLIPFADGETQLREYCSSSEQFFLCLEHIGPRNDQSSQYAHGGGDGAEA